MIPIYNRYVGNSGRFTRVNDGPGTPGASSFGPRPGQPYQSPPHSEPPNTGPPPGSPQGFGPPPDPPPFQGPPPNTKPPGKFLGGLGEMLNGILPFGLEVGDLMLLLLLLFLYTQSHDEEFLIILVVLGYTLYKSHGGKPLTKYF